jgi:hypothetical protein
MVQPPTSAASTARPVTSGRPVRRRRFNLTALQFVLFGGAGLVGLATLMAAGAALGIAVAGAGVAAALVLALWVIGANLIGMERRRR